MKANNQRSPCQALTSKGEQCKRKALPGQKYCWQHQPALRRWLKRITLSSIIAVAITIIGLAADLRELRNLQFNKGTPLPTTPTLANEKPVASQPQVVTYPSVKAMVTAVEAQMEPAMPEVDLLEITGDEVLTAELETFLDNPMPVFVGWRLLYRSSGNARTGIEATILEDGTIDTKSRNLSESQAEQRAITRWSIDIEQILEIVSKNDVESVEGSSFRLVVVNVNNIFRPVWHVPYRMISGQGFVVDAATGQLVCQIEGKPNKWEVCDAQY